MRLRTSVLDSHSSVHRTPRECGTSPGIQGVLRHSLMSWAVFRSINTTRNTGIAITAIKNGLLRFGDGKGCRWFQLVVVAVGKNRGKEFGAVWE